MNEKLKQLLICHTLSTTIGAEKLVKTKLLWTIKMRVHMKERESEEYIIY